MSAIPALLLPSTHCSQLIPVPGVKKLQLPLRHQLMSPEQTMLFMPARVTGTTSCKIVSVPRAGAEGLPGSTIMMDEKSGKVKAIMNARRLTALRNAAGEPFPRPPPFPPQNPC